MMETEPDSVARKRLCHFFNILSASPNDEEVPITNCDIFWMCVAILGRIIGIILTINVAVEYFIQGRINYFVWTLCCFLIPMVITTFLHFTIHLQDKANDKTESTICNIIWTVVVCPVLFRYFKSVSLAIASKRAAKRNDRVEQKRYYDLLVQEDSDVALIRIFECFLEAAPQKILQISIILSGEDKISVAQTLAIINSMFSMAWCIASYHRCIRLSQVDKVNLSWWGTIMQTLWHFLVTVSRIMSVAIIASLFPIWALVSFSAHAIIMCLWIFLIDKSPFCSTTILHSFLFSAILGFVFIFNYILPKARRTRYRYIVYYTICFLENIFCVLLFKTYSSPNAIYSEYFGLLCTLSIVPFCLGLVFMVIYYVNFHPNVISRKDIAITEQIVVVSPNMN